MIEPLFAQYKDMGDLEHYKKAFNSVGWFIPPYVTMQFLSHLAKEIRSKHTRFSQSDLEQFLALIHSPDNLAAMATERYPVTPYIQDYKAIISEAIEAHFSGLHHVAVSGLLPVIEGAAKQLAASRSVPFTSITSVFVNLVNHCKADVIANSIGAVGEIVSMLDSFIDFSTNSLYAHSGNYTLTDKTNRHGILHGAYSDEDYGSSIHFYKSISAIDLLCFISALKASVSWLAPPPTEASRSLVAHYSACVSLAMKRPSGI